MHTISADKFKQPLFITLLLTLGVIFAVLWELKLGSFTVMFIFLLLILVLPFFRLYRLKKFDFFDPLVLYIFIAIPAFIIRPLITYLDFESFARSNITGSGIVAASDIPNVLSLVISGTLFFYCGYYNRMGFRLAEITPNVHEEIVSKKILFIIILSAITFSLTWLYFVSSSGFSPQKIYSDFYSAVSNIGGDTMFIYRLSFMILHTSIFCLIIKKITNNNRKKILILISIFLLVIPLLIYSDRSIIATTIFQPLIIWHFYVKKFTLKQSSLVILGILIFITLFGALRAFYSNQDYQYENVLITLYSEQESQFGYWDNLLYIVNYYPEHKDFYYGTTIIEDIFGLMIPRRIWEDKPTLYGSDRVLNDLNPSWIEIGHHDAVSAVGAGYAEFGTIGTILTMFLFGLLCRYFYEYLVNINSNSIFSVALYAIVFFNLAKFFRGSISNFFILGLWLIPMIIVFRYATKLKRNSNFKQTFCVSNQSL